MYEEFGRRSGTPLHNSGFIDRGRSVDADWNDTPASLGLMDFAIIHQVLRMRGC